MMYSEKEIVKLYREAKHKKAQIKILSELNACDSSMIIGILLKNGYEQTTKFDYPTPIKEVKKEAKPVDMKEEEKRVSTIKSIRVAIEDRKKESTGTLKVKKMPKGTTDKAVRRSKRELEVEELVTAKISEEELRKRYVENRESIPDIVASTGLREANLITFMKMHDITRTGDNGKKVEVPISMLATDEELYDMYVTKRQTIAHIAEKLNVDKHRLAKHLENHDIVRTRKEEKSVSPTVIADAMVADKALEAKVKTLLDAAKRLREKADEFEAQAKTLQQAQQALSGNIGEDLGNVIKDIIGG